MSRESTGYMDRNKKEIFYDDVVRFVFCADTGYDTESGSEMIDRVVKAKMVIDGEEMTISALLCDLGSASFLFRHNDYCEVIGNVEDTPELLSDFQLREDGSNLG